MPLLAIIPIVATGCGDDPATPLSTQSGPAPDPKPFVRTVGSTGYDEVHDVAADAAGNVFVTGAFNDLVDFAGSTFDPALGPVFVAKFDPTGKFLWTIQISGASPDGPLSLGTDQSGDVILQGEFVSRLNVGGSTATTNGGGEHVFVARLSGAGSVKWISYDTGEYLSVAFGMGTGRSGGTAVTGFIQAGATFGDTELTVQGFDFFLARYDSQGDAVWAKQSGSDTGASGGAVAVDPSGNVVAAGQFVESFALDGVEITADAGDSFVARYNAHGELLWLKSLGDNTAESIHDIATDRDGDIYLAGRKTTSTLWKLDSHGNVIWEAPAAPAGYMAVGLEKNILLSGWFQGTLSVGDMTATSNGFLDFFVARYDALGHPVSLVTGGSSRDDTARGIAVDGYGGAITVVDFYDSFDLGGETITSNGEQDILIMRLE
jgi:hypothetical protein